MSHTCHWTGCRRAVDPRFWGCPAHWNRLPQPLRDAIWRHYKPGQEETKTPSDKYRVAFKLCQQWIAGAIEVHQDGTMRDVPVEQRVNKAANQ